MANNQRSNGQKQAEEVVVVMVPFPAQGHLNQLLHLSRLILSYNIPVHFASSAIHNRQAMLRLHGWDPNSVSNIHFHDFLIPPFLSPPPNPNAPNKFPSHLQPLFDASLHLRHPMCALLRELSSKSRRVIVINDSMMAYVVQDVGSIPNAESYTFHSVSVFALFLYLWEAMGKSPLNNSIPKDLPSFESCFSNEFLDFIALNCGFQKLSSGSLYNTCRIIEGPYLDLMEKIEGGKKHWAIGPFNPVRIPEKKCSNGRHKCLEWLHKQTPNSVIYVSFGTTTTMEEEQIKELAIGLEKSEQKFIWVLRDADKGDVFNGEVRKAELPKGFEERVKSRGMVVRDWAPQLEILSHPSTGAFMSHCGWNSCMESITMGVPIAAWPMASDQPRNTVLIAQLLKVGIVVKKWSHMDQIVTSSSVDNALKMLMASKEGDVIRKRAAELGGAVRRSLDRGGVSCVELDSFIAHITR
ncbi:zeatin O-glucosyltransferase-like [Corylus avellana]|uniref:zeatin O-glucosyltransferase-like n=1 Tax=Corylus avellana TaxID=13451 RepID=UPI00286B73A7|nr:zeatin O-glucosyltransferase-like [Corylus avellana]